MEVGVRGFGAGDEEEVHFFRPLGTNKEKCFTEAAFDAVAGDGGFENFSGGHETYFGGGLTLTEAEREKWPKNNTPPLGKEGEIAHAAQAIGARKHGISAC